MESSPESAVISEKRHSPGLTPDHQKVVGSPIMMIPDYVCKPKTRTWAEGLEIRLDITYDITVVQYFSTPFHIHGACFLVPGPKKKKKRSQQATHGYWFTE